MSKKNTSRLQKFLSSDVKSHVVLVAIAVGLYPMIFYYSNNFTMSNSWMHLLFFTLVFLLLPVVLFIAADKLFGLPPLARYKKYVLPFLTVFVFLFFLKLCLFVGAQKKIILGILIVSVLFSFFLKQHHKKVVVLQLLLAIVGLFSLGTTIAGSLQYSKDWMKQPDAIAAVTFTKKPNVYYIQPDGYANFSEISKGYYNIDNGEFEQFLLAENFKNYPDFRSNYEATLTSNMATFMMKHHYYTGSTGVNEARDARSIIVSQNTVLDAFKRNGYRTYFLTEKPYLLMNRPTMGYDECNFNYYEFPFIGSGMATDKSIIPSLEKHLLETIDQPKFFFVEIFDPKHIKGSKTGENMVEKNRQKYIEDLEKANRKLTESIRLIKDQDPNAMIIIMADHGGYVGMKYLQQGNEKTADRDKLYSIFTSQLSIHWPQNDIPDYDVKLKTSINLFRVVFSYLADDPVYLKQLQEDVSYGMIKKGGPAGIYQFIDENGAIDLQLQRLFKD